MEAWERYLYIISFIVVIVLNQHSTAYFSNFDVSKKDNDIKLLRKDIAYCFIIFFLFIVGILTWKLGDNNIVFDQLSFAGTVSSIILSVIAIFMTIASENKNTSMSGVIEKAKDSITHADNDIRRNSKRLSKVNKKSERILKSAEEYFDKFNDLMDRLNDLKSGVSDFKSTLARNTQQNKRINNKLEDIVAQLNRIEKDTHKIAGLKNQDSDFNDIQNYQFKYFKVYDNLKKNKEKEEEKYEQN